MKISTALGAHVKCSVLLFAILYFINVRAVRFPYLDTWKVFTGSGQARLANTICAPLAFFFFANSVTPQVSRYGNWTVRCSMLLFVMKISTACSLHKIQHWHEHTNYVRLPYALQRAIVRHDNINYIGISYTVIRLLTTGICFEKCVVRRFRHANLIECTYTNYIV
jgi:hypothetical protein